MESVGATNVCAGVCAAGTYAPAPPPWIRGSGSGDPSLPESWSNNASSCESCAVGQVDDDSDAGTPCVLCSAGQCSDAEGATACTMCPVGSGTQPVQMPGIVYRRWNGIGGTAVAQMLAHQAYLTPPNVEHNDFDLFESPSNVCNNCGTEMEGWFSPATTGNHTFQIAADDNAHLWLGTTEDVALANGEIASVPGWSSARQWSKFAEQTSAPVDLVAGQLYFIRAVSNEGGGGDNLAVGVTTPDGDLNPIPVVGGDSHVYLHQFDSSVSVALSAADCIATGR